MLKNLQQMHLKLAQKELLKKAKAAGDLIGNKIPDKKSQNNSETVINEKEISKERYISSDESQKIVDDLILIQQFNNGISKNNKFVR